MGLQVAIGGRKRDNLTPEKRINLMLQAGINVFILRWKKVHEFKTSYFGFEILRFVKHISGPTREAKIIPKIETGELVFEPDENKVPVAYAADTPKNRTVLANSFYSSRYVISGLITPSSTVRADEIQKEIAALAEQNGIPKPEARKVIGVYGDSVRLKPRKNATRPEPKTLSAARGVFGDKKDEILKEATTLNVDECFARAENVVHEKYRSLILKLQKEQPKGWKSSKYYTDVIGIDVLEETRKLLAANGHPEDSKPTPPKAPEQAPAAPATPAATAKAEPPASP